MIKSLNAHLIITNRIVRAIEQQPLCILIFIYRTAAAAAVAAADAILAQVTEFTYMRTISAVAVATQQNLPDNDRAQGAKCQRNANHLN